MDILKNTTPDTYRMYNPITRKVWETRNVIWMDWKRQDPQRDATLFEQILCELIQPAGVDEKELIIICLRAEDFRLIFDFILDIPLPIIRRLVNHVINL